MKVYWIKVMKYIEGHIYKKPPEETKMLSRKLGLGVWWGGFEKGLGGGLVFQLAPPASKTSTCLLPTAAACCLHWLCLPQAGLPLPSLPPPLHPLLPHHPLHLSTPRAP